MDLEHMLAQRLKIARNAHKLLATLADAETDTALKRVLILMASVVDDLVMEETARVMAKKSNTALKDFRLWLEHPN